MLQKRLRSLHIIYKLKDILYIGIYIPDLLLLENVEYLNKNINNDKD